MDAQPPPRKRVPVSTLDGWINIKPKRVDITTDSKPKKTKRRLNNDKSIQTKLIINDEQKNVPFIDSPHLLPTPPEVWCKYIIPKLDYNTLQTLCNTNAQLRHLIRCEHPFFQLKQPYSLYSYQAETILWMRSIESLADGDRTNCRGGLVSLSMGLGKTLISYIHCLMEKKYKTSASNHPTLVIASKQILWEWKNTLEKFFVPDTIRVLFLHSSVNKKIKLQNIDYATLMEYDIVITTYDVISGAFIKNDIVDRLGKRTSNGKIYAVEKLDPETFTDHTTIGTKMFFDMTWKRIIADESDKFANSNTAIFDAMMALQGETNWCLTGTPIRNKQSDLWSLFKFCGVKDLPAQKRFEVIRDVANTSLKFHIWQKDKQQVGIKLPPKTSQVVIVPWDKDEDALPWKCYLTYESSTKQMFNEEQLGVVPYTYVLALFTRMRQICDASYLVLKDLREEAPDENLGVEDVNTVRLTRVDDQFKNWLHDLNGSSAHQSPKMKAMWNIFQTIPNDEKVVIFTGFVGTVKLLVDLFHTKNIGVVGMDGKMSNAKRLDALDSFRNDADIRVLVITYQIGGAGLTLTEANNAILFDPWWTPSVLRQAEDRLHRLSQTKPVNCWTLAMQNSIEERMVNIDCKEKEEMIQTLQNIIDDSWNGTNNLLSNQKFGLKKGLDADTMYALLCG